MIDIHSLIIIEMHYNYSIEGSLGITKSKTKSVYTTYTSRPMILLQGV